MVRRAVGTPFMGYAGAVYLVQEIVNRLYDALFSFLPVDSAYARRTNGSGGAPAPAASGNLPWQAEARARLDAALEQLPYIPRISASRQLQMQVEALAHQRSAGEVTPGGLDGVADAAVAGVADAVGSGGVEAASTVQKRPALASA